MANILKPNWPAPANVQAFTTLRSFENTQNNILPSRPCYLNQVHGNKVINADDFSIELPEADASISKKSKTVCVVKTADCLPVLICDRAGTQVAAIHAGWRGLAAGVIANTCQNLSAAPQNCLAWIGPAIGPDAFEVGQDVLDGFLLQGWSKEVVSHAFKPKLDVANKWLGDLVFLARHTLQQLGFSADMIYGGEWCTYSEPERFYSYRRAVESGRLNSLIWLT